jgi:restriction endonuclease S subunit
MNENVIFLPKKFAKSFILLNFAGNYQNDNLKATKIAIPPLAEQERIVAILDKFEKLITSMEEGIPAEQIRQQKRYEYYRDLLLTFDRKAE